MALRKNEHQRYQTETILHALGPSKSCSRLDGNIIFTVPLVSQMCWQSDPIATLFGLLWHPNPNYIKYVKEAFKS